MNFFGKEFKKIFNDTNIKCFNNACYLNLNDNLRAKVEFITCGVADKYEAFRVQIINKRDGVVDNIKLKFEDILGIKNANGRKISPHVWEYNGVKEWYGYIPNRNDYMKMKNEIQDFIDVYNMDYSQSQDNGFNMNM